MEGLGKEITVWIQPEAQSQLFEIPGKRNGIYSLGLQKEVQSLLMFCKEIGQS